LTAISLVLGGLQHVPSKNNNSDMKKDLSAKPTLATRVMGAVDAYAGKDQTLYVAFSGGMDSTVLLHILAHARPARPIRAVYVDHGLQPESAEWGDWCNSICDDWDVPFELLRVTVEAKGVGLEAAGREARYEAFRALLTADEWLVTAHHRNDQLETALLALFRGSGPDGLAAMPALTRHHGVSLIRPCLDADVGEIRAYAIEHNLRWVEDPTNAELNFDRNFLRAEVVPKVLERWPRAPQTVARSARLQGEVSVLLEALAKADIATAVEENRLDITALSRLDPPRQRNALRYVLRQMGLPLPSEAQLHAALSALLTERTDASPCAAWPGARLRRYRGTVWMYSEALDPGAESANSEPLRWAPPGEIELGGLRGRLSVQEGMGQGVRAAVLRRPLTVRFREGGEQIRPYSEGPTRTLKKLLQEKNVLPWMRAHIPLIYSEEVLIAAGDLWVNADYAAQKDESSGRILWRDHAALL